jgi:cytochrome c oxidase subunit I
VNDTLFLQFKSGTKPLANAWFGLAIMALGIAALLAIVLVAARVPFLGLGGGIFRTALVLHVVFGVVVWFLAFAAGSWNLLCDKARPIGWLPLMVAVAGIACLLIAPVVGLPPPVLANYVPVLDSPLFLIGLFGFLLAVTLSGVLALASGFKNVATAGLAPIVIAARWAILVAMLAAIVFCIDFYRASSSSVVLPVTLDDKLWGTGHLMQFVHSLLMLAAWLWLGQRLIARVPRLARTIPWLLAAMALSSLAGPYISLFLDVGTPAHRLGYTELMKWATWPAPLLLGCFMLAGAWRSRSIERGEIDLFMSMALFLLGCLVGTMIQGNATTLVPAHYHGTVGAVTLAYLAVVVRAVELQGLADGMRRWLMRTPLLYGLGIGILVIGLAWSGLMGIPRKVPHSELMQTSSGYLAAMTLTGLGGFLALGSILAFLALMIRHAAPWNFGLRRFMTPSKDIRFRAITVTVTVILVFGIVADRLPTLLQAAPMQADNHVAEKRKAEIAMRFDQGVVMLHAKEYNHALTAFHRVIELAPEMPEAYVNTGFALLGLGKYAAARDFFDEATSLRREQYNAYYGMALALEGSGDLFGAMQAMETYLHRADKADPYRRKAEAAVWEWRTQLEKTRIANASSSDQLPIKAKN